MASPQIEDGFIMVANELWDAFCRTRIPGRVRQIIDVVIRFTYGFNKKGDTIALGQFAEITGMDRSNVNKAVQQAIDCKFINKTPNGRNRPCFFEVNKNYEEWKPELLRCTTRPPTRIKKQEPREPQEPKKKKGKSINALSVEELRPMVTPEFVAFWEAYPKKVAKVDALKAWLKLNPDEKLVASIMAFIRDAKKSSEWTKDGGQYVPNPATFLNGARWGDKLSTTYGGAKR